MQKPTVHLCFVFVVVPWCILTCLLIKCHQRPFVRFGTWGPCNRSSPWRFGFFCSLDSWLSWFSKFMFKSVVAQAFAFRLAQLLSLCVFNAGLRLSCTSCTSMGFLAMCFLPGSFAKLKCSSKTFQFHYWSPAQARRVHWHGWWACVRHCPRLEWFELWNCDWFPLRLLLRRK